jgi:hypothetical protein
MVEPSRPALLALAERRPGRERLADGSRVEPGPGARWEIVSEGPERVEVAVHEGAVTFDVSHNPQRAPFEVSSGPVRVRVLGTRFAVERLDAESVRVEVERGSVAVSAWGEETRLGAGASQVFAPPSEAPRTARRERRRPSESSAVAEVAGQAQANAASLPVDRAPAPEDPARAKLIALVDRIRAGGCASAMGDLDAFQDAHRGSRYAGDALYLEGYCHHALGRPEQATAIWRRYDAAWPGNPWLETVRDWTAPAPPSASRIR